MIIYGEILWMDQEHDKVWAYGPGTLTQWTDRALLTDKAPESKPAAAGVDGPSAAPGRDTARPRGLTALHVRRRGAATPGRTGGVLAGRRKPRRPPNPTLGLSH